VSPVVVSAAGESDFSAVKIVNPRGVVIAVESGALIVGELPLNVTSDRIEAVNGPCETLSEGFCSVDDIAVMIGHVVVFLYAVAVVTDQTKERTIHIGVLFKRQNNQFKRPGIQPVVAVHHADHLAGDAGNAEIAGNGLSAVDGGAQYLQPDVPRLPFGQDLGRTVGAAVVDGNELDVLMSLVNKYRL